jgi:hypothetical protein
MDAQPGTLTRPCVVDHADPRAGQVKSGGSLAPGTDVGTVVAAEDGMHWRVGRQLLELGDALDRDHRPAHSGERSVEATRREPRHVRDAGGLAAGRARATAAPRPSTPHPVGGRPCSGAASVTSAASTGAPASGRCGTATPAPTTGEDAAHRSRSDGSRCVHVATEGIPG